MNQDTNNQTGTTGYPSNQTNPQSNPFSTDFQGQFSSNFGTVGGTNTNVSQIFKEGGFGGDGRKKFVILGAVLAVAALIVGFLFMSGGDSVDEQFAELDSVAPAEMVPGGTDIGAEAAEAESVGEFAEEQVMTDEGVQGATIDQGMDQTAIEYEVAPSGSVQLTAPADGKSWSYDETQGAAPFSWDGAGGFIVFSRRASMQPEYMRVPVSGNYYGFSNPYPGTWYWRVENESGASEVRSFRVSAPVRRNLVLTNPTVGANIAGEGGVVSWQRAEKVAFYRVEIAAQGFANPEYRFSTSDVSIQLQGVAAGAYQMRLGAFSEVSGRWEYTAPQSVTIE